MEKPIPGTGPIVGQWAGPLRAGLGAGLAWDLMGWLSGKDLTGPAGLLDHFRRGVTGLRLVFSVPLGLSVERAGPLTRGRAAGRGP